MKQGRRVELLEEQTRVMNAVRASGDVSISGISGYACYRTVNESYTSMSQLVTNHPNLASWNDIGDSWDKLTAGGNVGDDIRVLVLTNKSLPGPKPRFFLMGAIHAREYTTAEMAARFAEEVASKYGTDADATWLLDHHELHVVVQSNPDGRRIAEQGLLQAQEHQHQPGCVHHHLVGRGPQPQQQLRLGRRGREHLLLQ